MTKAEILQKLDELPLEVQQEALSFIEMLVMQYATSSPGLPLGDESPKRRLVGVWEGKVWMSDDFDEPLEEFKDYM
jgi:Protein of unknown function (DUF2281)